MKKWKYYLEKDVNQEPVGVVNAKDINEAYVIASKIKLLDISSFKNLFKIVEFQNYGK